MLRPSRKQSESNHANNNGTYRVKKQNDNDDDASGKSKAIISNKTMGIAFSMVLVLTILVNLHSASHRNVQTSGQPPIERIPYKTIDELNDASHRNIQQANVIHSPLSLSPQQDEALERNAEDGVRSHLVFSTDCSSYQHWQSYLVYYSALKVRQPGHVTRIVSGCNDIEAQSMQEWFDTHVQHMSKRFHLHLTPHFSSVKGGGDYKFFNKPFGLRHWLEHSPQIEMAKGGVSPHEDDLVILIDPDMVLLRPITGDFTNSKETVLGPRKQKHPPFESMVVQHGQPFAQSYGLGSQWLKFNLDKIAGPDSPAKQVVRDDAGVWYPAGPPYIATLRDMYQIATKWTEFVPRVHAEYPHLLAEMFAYCIAAAHLKLPHKLVDSLMVSNPTVGGEGWPLVDKIPLQDMCGIASGSQPHDDLPFPSVVHFCQRYAVGDLWFFGKRRVPHDVFSCSHALLKEPPNNVATLIDYKQPPGQKEKKQLSKRDVGREAFMVCSMTALLNEAATFYKQYHCKPGTAVLEKTMLLGHASNPKKMAIGN